MARVKANGIELEYETHGPADAEPIVLVSGLGRQLTRWAPEFCAKLVDRGLRVVLLDNRDVGLSEKIESGGRPDVEAIFRAHAEGRRPDAPYQLDDMARDVVGLLDALGIQRAHIVGVSMGGMISQLVAILHPERVRSLTSIMSTTGNRALDLTTPEAAATLLNRPPDPAKDFVAYVAHALNSARVIGSPPPLFDEERMRALIVRDVQRCYYPVGFLRQYAAIQAAWDRREKLREIKCPVMVLHGEVDPLVKVAGGRDTHQNIPGSQLRIVPGMGHDIPLPLYDEIIGAIMSVVDKARG